MKVEKFFEGCKEFFKKYNIQLIHSNKYAFIYDIGHEHLIIERYPEEYVNCYFVKDQEIQLAIRIPLEKPLNTFRLNIKRRMIQNIIKYDGV